MSNSIELVSRNRSFNAWHSRYKHNSTSTNCEMTFAIYLPPKAEVEPVPVLYWLSGLTCTDENFMQKAGAQRVAAELGIAIVCPDTSPRGTNLPGEHDAYDFGSGAGFYVNATQEPWSQYYNMYDYVVKELPELITENFPVTKACSISGHSMGGHGALIMALKNPGQYRSVSALAPICNPSHSGWEDKLLSHYLGDESTWQEYDASVLVGRAAQKIPLLVDQGTDDEYLERLQPEALEAACAACDYPLTLRMQSGYDHSYYFVASFIEEHLRYHANHLNDVE